MRRKGKTGKGWRAVAQKVGAVMAPRKAAAQVPQASEKWVHSSMYESKLPWKRAPSMAHHPLP